MSFGWAELLPRYVQGNGLGYIDAVVSPLSQGRGGRGMDEGFNVVMEPSLGLALENGSSIKYSQSQLLEERVRFILLESKSFGVKDQ